MAPSQGPGSWEGEFQDQGSAAGLEDAIDLPERRSYVAGVANPEGHGDRIERAFGKRRCRGVAPTEFDAIRQGGPPELPAEHAQHRLGDRENLRRR